MTEEGKWAHRALDAAEAIIGRIDLPTAYLAAHRAVEELRTVAPALDRLGRDVVVGAVTALRDGSIAEGREALGMLSYAQRRGRLREATAGALAERDRREADAEDVWRAIMRAGVTAMQAASSALLASM